MTYIELGLFAASIVAVKSGLVDFNHPVDIERLHLGYKVIPLVKDFCP